MSIGTLFQIFKSNKFEPKLRIIFKIEFQNLIRRLKSRIMEMRR
jgi:hypothetical protein